MLKIKDKNGKTIMVLKDDASTPEPVEEVRVEEEEIPVEETEEGEEEDDPVRGVREKPSKCSEG